MKTATAAVRARVDEPVPTLPVPSSCLLCGSQRLALLFPARGGSTSDRDYCCTSFGHRFHGPIWGCHSCGVLFQWPIPDRTSLLEAYGAVEDPLYQAEKVVSADRP